MVLRELLPPVTAAKHHASVRGQPSIGSYRELETIDEGITEPSVDVQITPVTKLLCHSSVELFDSTTTFRTCVQGEDSTGIDYHIIQ